ncbi:MAG: hypothetical protein SFX18_12735 [Pirellulales bacterium]|nr:hypothetical protein [Pirellulales bacterium]
MTKNTFWLLLGVTLTVCAGILAMETLGRPRTVQLQIEGSHCEGCLMNVRKSLLNVPGVKIAEVKFVEDGTPPAVPSAGSSGDQAGSGESPAMADVPAEKATPSVEEPATRTAVATLEVDGWNTPSQAELIKAVEDAGKQGRVLP